MLLSARSRSLLVVAKQGDDSTAVLVGQAPDLSQGLKLFHRRSTWIQFSFHYLSILSHRVHWRQARRCKHSSAGECAQRHWWLYGCMQWHWCSLPISAMLLGVIWNKKHMDASGKKDRSYILQQGNVCGVVISCGVPYWCAFFQKRNTQGNVRVQSVTWQPQSRVEKPSSAQKSMGHATVQVLYMDFANHWPAEYLSRHPRVLGRGAFEKPSQQHPALSCPWCGAAWASAHHCHPHLAGRSQDWPWPWP